MKILSKLNRIFLMAFITITSSPLWAALPKPPDGEMASGNKGWIDIGGDMIYKALKYVIVAMGVAVLAGVVAGIIKAYHTAQERGDLGHLFKMLIVGLIVASICMAMMYFAYQILS